MVLKGEKKTKVEGERGEKREKKLQTEQGVGHGEGQVRVGMDAVCGHPAPQEHSHPGARDMRRETVALPAPLIGKHSQNKVVSLSESTGPGKVVGTHNFSSPFLRVLATPRQGALGLGAAVLGFPGDFTVRHPVRSPRRAGLACVCGHPHLAGVSPCAPPPTHPPPFPATLCPQSAQPSLRAQECSAKTQGARAAPHDSLHLNSEWCVCTCT